MINGFTRILGLSGFAALAFFGNLASAQQAPVPVPPRPPFPGRAPNTAGPFGMPGQPAPPAGVPGMTPAAVTPPTAPKPVDANAPISVSYVATPLNEVLDDYQKYTGKIIIKDPHLENATVTIESPTTMPKPLAVEFIEKSLLLSGYSIVPSGDKMVKVIAFEAGHLPSSERVNMILRESELPSTDEVVTYLLPLEYLKSDEAAQAFAQIVPAHSYGKLVAAPGTRAVIITENSNTIRAYIDLARQVDVAPTKTVFETIPLERADAEEVAKALGELLGITTGSAGSSGGSGGGGGNRATANGNRVTVKVNNPAPVPGVPGMPAAPTNPVTNLGDNEAEATAPKIETIARLNSILVVGRPVDIEYIKSLVKEFDAASNTRGFISRKLKYMDVVDFAGVSKDALLRGAKDPNGSDTKLKGAEDTKTTTTAAPASNSNTGSYGSAGLFGGSGGFGGGGGGGASGFSGGGGLQESQTPKMQSMFIGKTLLIVDPSSSVIYASGPPEQLKMLESLADELDVRPQQVLLSAIIGSFTLTNDFAFGLDWVRTLQTLGTNGSSVSGTLNTSGSAPVDFTSFSKLSDFPATTGLTVYGQLGKYANTFLTSLEDSKRFHVLQRPWVSTLNHKLATISTGQQIAIAGQTYSTGTTTTNTAGIYSTTQYIPVELRLDVIPHIYANNEIKLEFNQTNNDVSGFTTISGNQVPNLSTQSLKNTIIVPDGTTILLGGLITQRDTDNKTGLPFLSRIPLLGSLFSNTTKNRERDELLIFVQPHIVSNGGDYIQDQAQLEKLVRSYKTTETFINTGEPPPDKKRAKESKGHPVPEGKVNVNVPAVNTNIPAALPVDQSLDSRFGK